MGSQIIPLRQDIFFVVLLKYRSVVDEIGNAVLVAAVGDDADVIVENHDIPSHHAAMSLRSVVRDCAL